jgi:SH3-like domain-containing protein
MKTTSLAVPQFTSKANALRPLAMAFASAFLLTFIPTFAADFRTVGDKAAVWFDGPSQRANKLFVVPRNSPLEVVVSLDQWSKVRDETGDLGWVENKVFGGKRHVKTIVDTEVKASASEGAATTFVAARGIALELADPAQPSNTSGAWVRVIHRDGQSGWVQVSRIWGL